MILVTLMQRKKKSTNPKNNSNNNGMGHGRHSARFKLQSPVWGSSYTAFRFPEKIASKTSQDNIPINWNRQANIADRCAPQREPFTPVFCWLSSYNFSTLCKVLFWIAAAQNLTSCLFLQKYRFSFVGLFFSWSVIFHKNCCRLLKILNFVWKK